MFGRVTLKKKWNAWWRWQRNFPSSPWYALFIWSEQDTEFPGLYVSRGEINRFRTEEEAEYFLIRSNVEETKLIQIGLTIADEEGNSPYPICTWQFNFKFDIQKEKIVNQSAELLKKAGVQFDRLKSDGIDYMDFAEYFEASGFVYNRDVSWVVFHGSSDFAYLLRLVSNVQLPDNIADFYKEMNKYFPNIYDLKYIIKDVHSLKDVGLAKLSYEIGCNRIGPQHQAGSDSLLTLCCYFKMKEQTDTFDPIRFKSYLNVIFGIGAGFLKNSLSQYRQSSEEESSYLSRNYYSDERNVYYGDNRFMFMNHQYPPTSYGMGYGNNGNQGPLYSYMSQQSGNYMMYQQPEQQHQSHSQHSRRYWFHTSLYRYLLYIWNIKTWYVL